MNKYTKLYNRVLRKLDGKKITQDNLSDCAKKVWLTEFDLLEVLDRLVDDQYIFGDNEKIVYSIPYETYKELPMELRLWK